MQLSLLAAVITEGGMGWGWALALSPGGGSCLLHAPNVMRYSAVEAITTTVQQHERRCVLCDDKMAESLHGVMNLLVKFIG